MAQTKLLIRDDGMLYQNTKLVAKLKNFRPYYGDPRATLEERLRWLRGENTKFNRQEVKEELDPATFDIGKAAKADLIEFASQEFGVKLDSRKAIAELRQEVFKLAAPNDLVG